MSLFITHIRMSPPTANDHEHIDELRWIEDETSETGASTRSNVVAWLEDGNRAFVSDGTRSVEVGVVDATPKYLRTHADGYYNNNLLSLPRF